MKDGQQQGCVLVVGSANMDMVVSCARFPQPGETIFGSDFGMYPGGKGANQAVACARLGGEVYLLAKMGDDVFRATLSESLEHNGVRLDALLMDAEAPTGVALITVEQQGENEIVVVSGSNMRLRPEDVAVQQSLFAEATVVLAQLEVPLETVEKAAALAAQHHATFVLNPAPAQLLPASLLQSVDYLTPNEIEASVLSGVEVKDLDSAEQAATRLLEQGVRCVILTLGERGALHVDAEGSTHFPAVKVQAKDTTAAGDAFNGALALCLARGMDAHEAIPFANTVAAFAVSRKGAQTSMPTNDELHQFMEQRTHRLISLASKES